MFSVKSLRIQVVASLKIQEKFCQNGKDLKQQIIYSMSCQKNTWMNRPINQNGHGVISSTLSQILSIIIWNLAQFVSNLAWFNKLKWM
ncbi:hypothetical protein FGO68_gene15550 [Halteria grandinella]|uniref:Uncharacterized protein n=1 Tax=Halteria grandinella TaxID=5974 RepID=A0A8J8T3I0_HALGN|nr:hypothetical protein FGO68_gene15550 [Halteria grandinella]